MCMEWANKRMSNLRWYDMAFTKLSVFSAALMVADLWRPILNLDWYWYLIISLVLAARPTIAFFSSPKKKKKFWIF